MVMPIDSADRCVPQEPPIDAVRLVGHLRTVSAWPHKLLSPTDPPAAAAAAHAGLDPNKKHRHDIGAVDHGAVTTVPTTVTIQVIMGTGIVLSVFYLIYAMLVGWFQIAAP